MAVAAILAAALVPMLVRKYDQTARDSERKSLNEMAEAYQTFVQDYRIIPNYTTVFDNIGLFWGRPKWIVQTNERANLRFFVYDDGMRLGTNFTVHPTLPFVQDYRGTTNKPIRPRAMIISSMGPGIPAASGISANCYLSTALFDALWDLAPGTLPATAAWNAWPGVGDDLLIKKIDMTSWFEPIKFTSTTDNGIGRFRVDNNTTLVAVNNTTLLKNAIVTPPPPYVINYYLHGTILRFVHASASTVQAVEIVQAPCNYLYERGIWRVDIPGFGYPRHGLITADDIVFAADQFLSVQSDLDPTMRPGKMLMTISNYMWQYTAWSKGQATGNTADAAAKDVTLQLSDGIK